MSSYVMQGKKIIVFLLQVIFVLRKKDSQIIFLHVFHHTTVPVIAWLGVSYGPGGYNSFFPMVNSFVHVWMYLYYGLASLGPESQKYLGWKKYLTSLQLVNRIE
ncbi:Elongation of very long chain fatty acids protein 7 [Araneus ventricosus]|uniref:Elongation of very long chain fatty acids protein n=1 Tax=Araneus ventricosus TaxID=182803 RepID=A0A4Y2IV22_ARAVE|nr:Elongation of very long chain fatty acids protein 7 [Araneus ventricosus]